MEASEMGPGTSFNLGRYETKDFWVTAAGWNGCYGTSYEIGVRRKSAAEEFELIQAGWNERTVQKAAVAVTVLLDAGWDVEAIREVICPR